MHLSHVKLLQSGFPPPHSNKTFVSKITNDLHVAKSNDQSSVHIWLEFSAAFDKVDIYLLLDTLSSLVFQNSAFRFYSYLWSLHLDFLCWILFSSQPFNVGILEGLVLGLLLSPHSLLWWSHPAFGFTDHLYANNSHSPDFSLTSRRI